MYRTVYLAYPRPLREALSSLLVYSNIKISPEKFLGNFLLFNLIISILISILISVVYKINAIIFFLIIFIILYIAVYLWLLVYADRKAKLIEESLPDALHLMASNLRAGFTTDKALLLSARPEFGPLQEEINIVGKEITTGKPIEEALLGITNRVRSDTLSRAIHLIISGIKSGGKLAELLQQTANELKSQKLVDKKIRTSVNMYVIFIFIATAFGAPMLLGLSSFLVEVLSNTLKNIQIPTNVAASFSIPIAMKGISVPPSFVFKYAILIILTTSIMGSFTIGLISKGREKEGIKLIIPLLLLALGTFFLVRFGAQNLIGGFFSSQ